MPQNQQPLDAKKIGEYLTNMKKQLAQVEGEMSMMKNDAQSSLFQNFAGMINSVFKEKENFEQQLKEAHTTLDEIYQGHPDILLAVEAKAKEQREAIAKKAPGKLVKKGK